MPEPGTLHDLEGRLADLVGRYTDAAARRPVDPLELARAAMATTRARGARPTLLGGRLPGWPTIDRWAVVAVAILVVGAIAIGMAVRNERNDSVVGRPSAPAASASDEPSADVGSILDILRHAWQRPYPVTPGPDVYGSGFLTLTGGSLAYGREPGPDASRTTIAAGAAAATFVVTATAQTVGCRTGDVGTYQWLLEGRGTYLTLTAELDTCAARQRLLAGPWVRGDLPGSPGVGTPLASGTYHTTGFDPFEGTSSTGRLSYTVPDGWALGQDDPGTFVLIQAAAASGGRFSTDLLIALFTNPALLADIPDGMSCDAPSQLADAPGVGRSRDALAAAIRARAGVVSTTPKTVSFGALGGTQLDVQLDPTWTRGCATPSGVQVAIPLLHPSGSTGGPVVGIASEVPARLILVEVAPGRAVAIAVVRPGPSGRATADELFGAAMPVVRSLEFQPRGP